MTKKRRNVTTENATINMQQKYRNELGYSLRSDGYMKELMDIKNGFEEELNLIAGETNIGIISTTPNDTDYVRDFDNAIIDVNADTIKNYFTNKYVDYVELYLFYPARTKNELCGVYLKNCDDRAFLANCYFLVRNSKNKWIFFYGYYAPFETAKGKMCRELYNNDKNVFNAMYQIYVRDNMPLIIDSVKIICNNKLIFSHAKSAHNCVLLKLLNNSFQTLKFYYGLHEYPLMFEKHIHSFVVTCNDRLYDITNKKYNIVDGAMLFGNKHITMFERGIINFRYGNDLEQLTMGDRYNHILGQIGYDYQYGFKLVCNIKYIDMIQLSFFDENTVEVSMTVNDFVCAK